MDGPAVASLAMWYWGIMLGMGFVVELFGKENE